MKYLIQIFRTVRKESPVLYFIVWFHFLMALGCVVGLLVDDRMLIGLNVWIKPLKFTISGGIYILTVGLLITLYPFSEIKKHIIRNVVSWTMLLEIMIIVVQAARGVQSHYNTSSEMNGMLFGMMGLLIGVNVLIMLYFIIETLRLKLHTAPSVRWAILLGWIIVFFGSWIGGQMITQLAHNVGVADGGEGLVLLNWSTVAGDLRVAHFFGLHGLQIIPVVAFVLHKTWGVSQKTQVLTVFLFGLLYICWVGFHFYQAKQGLPFIGL